MPARAFLSSPTYSGANEKNLRKLLENLREFLVKFKKIFIKIEKILLICKFVFVKM